MAKESKDEKAGVMEKERDSKGHPEKRELSPKSELPEGMKKPAAPGEQAMGGVKKSGHMGNESMGKAVKHLNKETERHMKNQHSGKRM